MSNKPSDQPPSPAPDATSSGGKGDDHEGGATATAAERSSHDSDNSDSDNKPQARNQPEQPPADGIGRMLSVGRIFGTGDSISGLLASTDSATAARLEGLFRSGASIGLPPLSVESEAALAAVASKRNSNSSVALNSDSFARELVKSESSDIQKIMQSASRAAKAAVEENNKNLAAAAGDSELKDKKLPVAPANAGNNQLPDRRSGIFTSRDWGNHLGSFQDVDIQSVFQTSRESLEKLSAAAAAQKTDSKETPPPDRRPKKKRDWNALVMNDLEASIAKPQRPAGATPADAALLAAAAAAFGKCDGAKPQTASGSPGVPRKDCKSPPPVSGSSGKSKISEAAASADRVFVEPMDGDVLMGRGGRSNNHPGNKRYLECKEEMQPRYMAADKNGKTPISQELVDVVKAWGGRFLKLDAATQKWYEVDNTTARKKASQTLREINTAEERAAKRARYAK